MLLVFLINHNHSQRTHSTTYIGLHVHAAVASQPAPRAVALHRRLTSMCVNAKSYNYGVHCRIGRRLHRRVLRVVYSSGSGSARLWLGVKPVDSNKLPSALCPTHVDLFRSPRTVLTLIKTMQSRRANVICVRLHTRKLTRRPRTV